MRARPPLVCESEPFLCVNRILAVLHARAHLSFFFRCPVYAPPACHIHTHLNVRRCPHGRRRHSRPFIPPTARAAGR